MIDFKFFPTSKSLPPEWDVLVGHDVFLKSAYLQALEDASPKNISLYFIGFYNQNKLEGVAVIQRVQLYLNDIFRNNADSCFKQRLKNTVSKFLKGNILVVGNLTHTGQHGLFFNTSNTSTSAFLSSLFLALNELKAQIKIQHKKRIRAILLKDFFLNDAIHNEAVLLENQKLYKLSVQPNMIMPVKSEWKTFDNYISDLHKKYRDRYKSARKKINSIKRAELDEAAVREQSKALYALYKCVSDNAKINTFILPENHFYGYKKQLQENFRIFGYYLNDELIGFYSLILNNKELETYFLGYKPEYQFKHQLYLNMLYDMAEFGINYGFSQIIYARTAMEIKSSVGAKPQPMVMYLKHTNIVMNAVLKLVFAFMNPSKEWEERHPFK